MRPVLPVQRHVHRAAGQHLGQRAAVGSGLQQQVGHHAPAHAQRQGLLKGVHRRHKVSRVQRVSQVQVLGQKRVLQRVLAVEDHRRAGQHLVQLHRTAAGCPLRDQRGRGHAAVAHQPQRLGHAAAHGGGQRGHTAGHVAVFQRVMGVVLVVNHHVKQQSVLRQQVGQAG